MTKKLLLALSFVFSLLFVHAEELKINVSKSAGTHVKRTPDPSIYAYIEDGVITVSIDRYLGYVFTSIEDANGAEIDSDTEYINGTSTYVMNVSALTPGTYTVYFMFSDGREYYGIFTVE